MTRRQLVAGMLGLSDMSAYASELDEVLGRDNAPDGDEYAQFMARLEQLVRAA